MALEMSVTVCVHVCALVSLCMRACGIVLVCERGGGHGIRLAAVMRVGACATGIMMHHWVEAVTPCLGVCVRMRGACARAHAHTPWLACMVPPAGHEKHGRGPCATCGPGQCRPRGEGSPACSCDFHRWGLGLWPLAGVGVPLGAERHDG